MDAASQLGIYLVDHLMSSFPLSSYFEAWITRLRMSWMGKKGQAIFGGFGAALGDRGIDWVTMANLQHLPEYADPAAVTLIASERQIDVNPLETTAALATRLTYAVPLSQFYGRPLGLLLAMYYASFPGAIIVQQNGLVFSLSGTPDLSNPTAALQIAYLSALDVPLTSSVTPSRVSIPTGTKWWFIDSDTDFCSRFEILFPGPQYPGAFTTWATATFTGTDNTTITWNNAFVDTSYIIQVGPPSPTDGGGGIVVWADASTKTTTGITVRSTAAFTGTVDLLAWQSGSNPFVDPHPSDLLRLRSIVSKWRPAKANCVDVKVIAQGKFSAWPVGAMAQMLGVPSTIVSLAGPWS